jgi:DNA-binding CsgD family transcriptional regulator
MRETNQGIAAEIDCGRWVVPAITGLGGPSFHAALLAGLRDMVGADHVTDLCYGRDGALTYSSAVSLLNQGLIEWTTNLYVNGNFYLRDPHYAQLCGVAERRRQEQPIVEVMSPDLIGDEEYRRLLFERPGFASKISIIGAGTDGASYINLYFSRQHGSGVAKLMHGCAPLLVALSQRHRELSRSSETRDPVAQAAGLSWHLGLSLREIQVGELMRQGRTAKQIGRELGLSPTTVVTYKNRIFKKNQVASLREFLVKAPEPARP